MRYVIVSTLAYYGLGRVFDAYGPETGFFWIAGVGLSTCGMLLLIIIIIIMKK